jgi:hypothetical protein
MSVLRTYRVALKGAKNRIPILRLPSTLKSQTNQS